MKKFQEHCELLGASRNRSLRAQWALAFDWSIFRSNGIR